MLERIMSSKTKVRVLRLLISNPNREFSMDEIVKGTKSSWGTVHPSMKSLVSLRVITVRKAGGTKLYRANERNPLYAEISGAFKGEKEAFIRIAKEFASKVAKRGIRMVILFGSAARGEATEKSDIDLIFITKDAKAARMDVDALAGEFAERYDAVVSPMYMTQDEFNRRKKVFDRFVMNVLQEGVILYGGHNGEGNKKNRVS